MYRDQFGEFVCILGLEGLNVKVTSSFTFKLV